MSIPLPPIPEPYVDTWPLTPEKLRARDQEIVATVLEAAAMTVKNGSHLGDLLAANIRALEFAHDGAALGDKT